MVDVETQLRRYADAVQQQHDSASGTSLDDDATTIDSRGRRDGRWLLAAAVGLVGIVAGVLIVLAARSESSSVITDPTPSISTPTSTSTPVEETSLGAQLMAPRLLPEGDRWVLVGHETQAQAASGGAADVWAFSLDGHLFILISQPHGGEDMPLAEAEVTSEYNRGSVWWTEGDQLLGFEGFDVNSDELLETARTLVRVGDDWQLPGADALTTKRGAAQSPGDVFTVKFAPRAEDGAADLSNTVDQYSRPATSGDLYRELFEASSLGTTTPIQIVGTTGYVITGGPVPYGLWHADGYLTTWQANSTDVDLAGLLASLQPASQDSWNSRIDAAASARRDAIEQAADQLEPIQVEELPRYVLPEPWHLESVTDQTLWSDEQRRQWRAQIVTSQGNVVSRLVWVQTFTSSEHPSALPDILLGVTEYTDWPAEVTSAEDSEPFSLGTFEGFVSHSDVGNEAEIISVRDGNHTVEISSTTLSRDQLAAFAQTLTPRSPTGADGFDTTSTDFEAELDSPSPYPEDPTAISSWTATWSRSGRPATITVSGAPSEMFELILAETAIHLSVEPIPGERYWQIDDFEGGGGLIWWHETQLTAQISIFADSAGDALDAARALQQITEGEWTTIATPLNNPPELR